MKKKQELFLDGTEQIRLNPDFELQELGLASDWFVQSEDGNEGLAYFMVKDETCILPLTVFRERVDRNEQDIASLMLNNILKENGFNPERSLILFDAILPLKQDGVFVNKWVVYIVEELNEDAPINKYLKECILYYEIHEPDVFILGNHKMDENFKEFLESLKKFERSILKWIQDIGHFTGVTQAWGQKRIIPEGYSPAFIFRWDDIYPDKVQLSKHAIVLAVSGGVLNRIEYSVQPLSHYDDYNIEN